jgi:hypothetical protein
MNRRTGMTSALIAWTVVASLLPSCANVGPGGITTATPEPQSKVYAISCDDAHRYAARALKTRGYRITTIERGPGGGVVAGTNKDNSSQRLAITCAGQGATVAAAGGGHWADQGLWFTFNQVVDVGDRIWPPPTGPIVNLELIQGVEAKLEFPQELEPLGMVAVRVNVFNGGARAIRFDPRRIRGRMGSGAGAVPLADDAVKSKLAADPAIAGKILQPAKLQKGQGAKGFVFLPAAQYKSAVLFLVDDQTGEADEFETSFEALS